MEVSRILMLGTLINGCEGDGGTMKKILGSTNSEASIQSIVMVLT